MISLAEALALVDAEVQVSPAEWVPLEAALGRVLATAACSDVDVPPHRKSLVDGYAVRSADLTSPGVELAVVDEVVAGGWPARALEPGQATRIMTGAAVPEGADAVVMVEETSSSQNGVVRIDASAVRRFQNLMEQAAVMHAGQAVLPRGQRLTSAQIGLLAETGHAQVSVSSVPKVAIIATGNELVPPEQKPGLGQIRNSNGAMLAAAVRSLGVHLASDVHVRDDAEALARAMRSALENEVLVLSGGVSAGILDLVPAQLQSCGVVEIFHKVSLKPGKPIWFGRLDHEGHRCLVFGLPGNPVSSLVCFQLFVRRALLGLLGDATAKAELPCLQLAQPFEHRGPRPTYWPAKRVTQANPPLCVKALPWRGSGDLLTVAQADGWIGFAAGDRDYRAGELVPFLDRTSD